MYFDRIKAHLLILGWRCVNRTSLPVSSWCSCCWRRTSAAAWLGCSSASRPQRAQSSPRTTFRIWPTNISDPTPALIPPNPLHELSHLTLWSMQHKRWAHGGLQDVSTDLMDQCALCVFMTLHGLIPLSSRGTLTFHCNLQTTRIVLSFFSTSAEFTGDVDVWTFQTHT